jgi:hypothetical protein
LAVVLSGTVRAEPPVREKARDIHGQVVRVIPEQNVVVVRTGTGTDVKEVQYSVGKTTKYWATAQEPITEGLRYKGWKEGSDVWLRLGDDNRVVTDIRFYDPATEVIDIRGKIVRVDPDKGVIVIRSGTGTEAKEVEYTVDKSTAYWATEQQRVNDGLRYQGFAPGADVWYRVGPRGRVISDVRFYDPAVRRPRRP